MADLGNYSGLLSLADRNNASASVQNSYIPNTLGSLGTSAVANNPYTGNGENSGWQNAQKYLQAGQSVQKEPEKKKGLTKILGLVGMLI